MSKRAIMNKKQLEEHFVNLISENESMIYKICNIYANSNSEKEDLKQEIIYQLWKSFPSFRGEAKVQTWMYKVALNTALYFNKKKSHPLTDFSNAEMREEESPMETEEQLKKLYKAIRVLDNIDRAIILLYLEKKTYLQISEIIGITEKHVSVKLVRIKDKLKTLLLV